MVRWDAAPLTYGSLENNLQVKIWGQDIPRPRPELQEWLWFWPVLSLSAKPRPKLVSDSTRMVSIAKLDIHSEHPKFQWRSSTSNCQGQERPPDLVCPWRPGVSYLEWRAFGSQPQGWTRQAEAISLSGPDRGQGNQQVQSKQVYEADQNWSTDQVHDPAVWKHGKDCEQRVCNAACRATGLKWAQIYKWLYDFH